MENLINGKEMSVCFVDPNADYLKVVGFGKNGTEALMAACAQFNGITGDDNELNDWAAGLDQYFISNEAVAEFEEKGACPCKFCDDLPNLIVKAG